MSDRTFKAGRPMGLEHISAILPRVLRSIGMPEPMVQRAIRAKEAPDATRCPGQERKAA